MENFCLTQGSKYNIMDFVNFLILGHLLWPEIVSCTDILVFIQRQVFTAFRNSYK